MPVDKSSASFMRIRASSPYTASLHTPRVEKQSHVRIYTPSIDDRLFSNDFAQYDAFDESTLALSLWTNAGSFPDSEIYGSTSACPPSFIPPVDDSPVYDEPIDSPGFPWPYDGGVAAGYDASYPDSSSSAHAFSPSISIVSSSPRSEHSLSLSPQPPFPEYSNAFNFDFSTTSNPLDFPTSSSPTPSNWSGPLELSPKSESHSPALSASSLDPSEIKSSPSREPSPLQIEPDPQNARRRFPCLILGCERRFTSQYTLKVHMEAHKPKPRVSFPCTLGCSERFSRQHDRLRHEVAKHGKVCEFSCDECGRFFSTKKTLGNHKCPVAQGGTRWVNS